MSKPSNAAGFLAEWGQSFYQTFRERNGFKAEDRISSATETLVQNTFNTATTSLREAGVNVMDAAKTHQWLKTNASSLKMSGMLTDSFLACSGYVPPAVEPPAAANDQGAAPAAAPSAQPSAEASAPAEKKQRKPRGPNKPKPAADLAAAVAAQPTPATPDAPAAEKPVREKAVRKSKTPAEIVVDPMYARFATSWYEKTIALSPVAESDKAGLRAHCEKFCQDFGTRMGGKPVDVKVFRNSFSIPIMTSRHYNVLMRGFDKAAAELTPAAAAPAAPAAA